MHLWDSIWIFFILSSLQPVIQKQLLAASRRRMLMLIAARRKARGDPALERRFQPVLVRKPTVDETIEILHGLKDR